MALVGMLASAAAVLASGAGFAAGRLTIRPVKRDLAAAVQDRYAALLRVQTVEQERDAAQVQARTDPLTGLANRAGLLAALAERAAAGRRWVLAMVDVDHFKWFNTTYGYSSGDAVLVEVGRRLTAALADGDGVVGRIGGDELVIAVNGEMPWLIAERVQRALQEPVVLPDGQQVQVTASVGLVQALPQNTVRPLLHSVDTALRAAKLYGRNRAVEFGANRELIDVQTERPVARVRELTSAGTSAGLARLLAEVPDAR